MIRGKCNLIWWLKFGCIPDSKLPDSQKSKIKKAAAKVIRLFLDIMKIIIWEKQGFTQFLVLKNLLMWYFIERGDTKWHNEKNHAQKRFLY